MEDTYWRRSRFVRAVDGETLDMQVDLGFHTSTQVSLRLIGVAKLAGDSREETERLDREAIYFINEWFREHLHGRNSVYAYNTQSKKSDKQGRRFLGHIECSESHSLADSILESGRGQLYTGKSRR